MRPLRWAAVFLAAMLSVSLIATPAASYPTTHVEFEGHGSGHGLGMGAWGAYGMAWNNPSKSGESIAAYYYPGSSIAISPNHDIRSWLEYDQPLVDTIVTAGDPATADPRTPVTFTIHDSTGSQIVASDPVWSFWRVKEESGKLRLQKAQNSAGGPSGWDHSTQQHNLVEGFVEFRPPRPQDHETKFLQVLTGTTWRYFRGNIRGVLVGGSVYTVGSSTVEEYLYGVMRAEGAPSRWDTPGKESLRALAIAARSYALHKRSIARASGEPYDLCSTSSCQNYKGWGWVTDDGVRKQLEDDRTNAAVDTTALKVLTHPSEPSGRPILGAYASSSGGYTKPGFKDYFAPVPDPHDNFSGNSVHLWKKSVGVSTIESMWPSIGALRSIEITKRNGYGDWGGRVVEAHFVGSSGTVVVSGNTVRQKLGFKSDWFRVVGGYWVAASDGGVFTFGSAPFYGSAGGIPLAQPIVGMTANPEGGGYWLVARDGGIFTYGNTSFHGSTGHIRLNKPVVGMAPHPSGTGYWLVATDGGIFSFGASKFFGSTGNIALNQPVVGMAATPSGKGYWLVASDGGIFAFGDARFYGSTGNLNLKAPVVGMAATKSGKGYWLVASDGGIFSFGDAPFYGSAGGQAVGAPIVEMARASSGGGYWLLGQDGRVFAFGDAVFHGSVGNLAGSAVGLTSGP